MGEDTIIINKDLLIKIYWKDHIQSRNEKRSVKARLLEEHVGKLCVVFQEKPNHEYIPTSIVTVLPNDVDLQKVINELVNHYKTENCTIENKEKIINIASIQHNDGLPSLRLAIQIYASKNKILIQSTPNDLENFVKSYVNILMQITGTNEDGTSYNMAEKVFGLTMNQLENAEVTLHADTEVTQSTNHVDKPDQIDGIQHVLEDTSKPTTPAPNDNKAELNFEQKAFSMFLELKESMKDIQKSIDLIMPSIKKIDKIEENLADCQTQCLALEEDFISLDIKVSSLTSQHESLKNDISSVSRKNDNLTTRLCKIEAQLLDLPKNANFDLESIQKHIEDNIITRINQDIEKAMTFTRPESLASPHQCRSETKIDYPPLPQQSPIEPSNTKYVKQQQKQQQQQHQQHPLPPTSVSNSSPPSPKVHNTSHTSPSTSQQPTSQSPTKDPKQPIKENHVNEVKDGTTKETIKNFHQEAVLIGDSNTRYISPLRFPQPIAKIRCGTLEKLPEVLKSVAIPNARNVVVHLGTNDIETCSQDTFQQRLFLALDAIEEKFPEASITMSELLPRKDNQKYKVDIANKIILDTIGTIPWKGTVGLFSHSYTTEDMLADEKHLKREHLKTFISGIKNILFGRRTQYSEW